MSAIPNELKLPEGTTLEKALESLTVEDAQVLYWKFQEISYPAIGLEFRKSEGWVEAVMRRVYEKLGLGDKSIHSLEKTRRLKKYYKSPFQSLIWGDFAKIAEVFGAKEPKVEPDIAKVETQATNEQVKAMPAGSAEDLPRVDQKPVSDREVPDVPGFPRRLLIVILLLLVCVVCALVGWRIVLPMIGNNTPTVQASQTPETLIPPTTTIEPSAIIPLADTQTALPTSTLTPTLTFTPTATITPIPTDTKSPNDLRVGDALDDGRVTLRLTKVGYNEKYDRLGARVAPISYYFNFTNNSGETIVLQFDTFDFTITDDTGTEANCWFYHISGAGETVNEPLNNGATREIVARCGLGQLDPAVNTFSLNVSPFSSLPESTWVVEIPR